MTVLLAELTTLRVGGPAERFIEASTTDEVVATIENKPGQAGSLAVYNHLAQIHGAINAEAASQGLAIYAEHTVDARANPGKHPNIDRLIDLIEAGRTLRVKQVFAQS